MLRPPALVGTSPNTLLVFLSCRLAQLHKRSICMVHLCNYTSGPKNNNNNNFRFEILTVYVSEGRAEQKLIVPQRRCRTSMYVGGCISHFPHVLAHFLLQIFLSALFCAFFRIFVCSFWFFKRIFWCIFLIYPSFRFFFYYFCNYLLF